MLIPGTTSACLGQLGQHKIRKTCSLARYDWRWPFVLRFQGLVDTPVKSDTAVDNNHYCLFIS